MNYRERGYEELPYTGLSPDYVYRETKRCVEGAKGTAMQIWPGIDVDISNMDPNFSRCTPPVIKEVTQAAYRGGGQGLGDLAQVFRDEAGESGRRRRRIARDEDRVMSPSSLTGVIDIHVHCGPDSMPRTDRCDRSRETGAGRKACAAWS